MENINSLTKGLSVKSKKAETHLSYFYDVTIGSSAILFKWNCALYESQTEILIRPEAFRPHLTMSLALLNDISVLPTERRLSCQERGMHILMDFSIESLPDLKAEVKRETGFYIILG